ncbi:MAG: acyltransferase domain-containing protein, partial [Acidobacteriota bacterium]
GAGGRRPGSVALGSVKSNIGHLKAAAGAAGLLKVVLALHDKVLPPSINFTQPNHNIDFRSAPFYVNTELREWPRANGDPRLACASAFGFGGTNFHCVLQEYDGTNGNTRRSVAVAVPVALTSATAARLDTHPITPSPSQKAPLRGALVIGAPTIPALRERLIAVQRDAAAGRAPAVTPPSAVDIGSPERIAIDFGSPAELADRAGRALKALDSGAAATWKLLRNYGVFRGSGTRAKVAFLYPGQGSQYVNMLRGLRDREPIVAQTFAEADEIAAPLLGKALTEFLFVADGDSAALARAEEALKQTSITQPAVLTVDLALTRLLAAYGIVPDLVMGHSLGEYGALQAAGAIPFADAIEAVSARGREMTRVAVADNGKMAAVSAPLKEIEKILRQVDGYVVIANVNSRRQAVIGGATAAVELAVPLFEKAGYTAVLLPVSHAFHTSIVAPASEPLRRQLSRLRLSSPKVPIVSNVTGEWYPTDGDVRTQMLDLLARQVAEPVQFTKGLDTLYASGARIFVEVGPKKALHGFVDEAFGDSADVLGLFTNHPKFDDAAAFNQALCGLYAAGLGQPAPTDAGQKPSAVEVRQPAERPAEPDQQHVVITGAALGLPGNQNVFADDNVLRILRGDQFIDVVPARARQAMVEKRITRLVKTEDGSPRFDVIDNAGAVIKLAARSGHLDLASEFGIPADRVEALDSTTALAIGAGLDALRDAGLPLVLHYKNTSRGTKLPDRWGLPEPLRDETGVIFASAFPGCDAFASEMSRYYADRLRREQLALLHAVRSRLTTLAEGDRAELDRRIADLQRAIDRDPYVFDRRFLMRVLPMGHSQFAELIGARGPNTQLNAACASTTQAISLAHDWIQVGRCRRVVVVSADNVTSDHL